MGVLGGEELAELPPLDQLADHHHHLLAFHIRDLLVVILHQNGAVPQGIELAGIGDGGFAGGIAVGVVELRGPADAGVALDNRVNLALPATSERSLDDVFSRHRSAGGEVESLDLAGAVHGRPIIPVQGAFSIRPGPVRSSDNFLYYRLGNAGRL